MEYDEVIKESVHIKESISNTSQTYFSIQHIQSVALFARNAYSAFATTVMRHCGTM